MIKSLITYQSPFFWFSFHLLLGVASAISPLFLIIYFYLSLLLFLPYIFRDGINTRFLDFVLVYLISFEVLARMAQTSPYIPYELGKYLMTAFLIIGIATGQNKGKIGLVLVLLLLPAFFYDLSYQVTNRDIVFNLLGPINIGLAVWYFYRKQVSEKDFSTILRMALLPLISSLSFTVFKTPDLDSIEFSLGANFDTTAGFGSNQVATIFGVGMMLSFYMWLTGMKISGKTWADLGIIFLFTFQGLLSFSRGGMLGGFLGILVIIWFISKVDKKTAAFKRLNRSKKYLLPSVIVLGVTMIVANNITEGNLLLRYLGETQGTLEGKKDRTLNNFTTNRSDIFLSDVELFTQNPPLGVGAGASKYLRQKENGVVAHVEMSRLIAEHGIFGILYSFIIFFLIIRIYRNPGNPIYKSILVAFILVGWYTTFHGATRTYITPLFIGLSLVQIRVRKMAPSKKTTEPIEEKSLQMLRS